LDVWGLSWWLLLREELVGWGLCRVPGLEWLRVGGCSLQWLMVLLVVLLVLLVLLRLLREWSAERWYLGDSYPSYPGGGCGV
jgi:hypothetical protein